MKNIHEMSDSSRVWVYQANRFFSAEEEVLIVSKLTDFLFGWASHGASLDSGFEIKYSRFVIVAVNEEKALASGCGIDKLVHFFQELGRGLNIDFFDRMQVVYRSADAIVSEPLHQFWGLRKACVLSDDSIVFDNLVKNLAEYHSKWETSFSNSWHAEMWGR
jgi:hypothetical protein